MATTHLRDFLATSFSIVLLFAAPCAAQQALSARIDRYIEAEMRRQQIPGVSLAVLRNGRIALLKSYGLSNVEHQVPVKPETVIHEITRRNTKTFVSDISWYFMDRF